MFENTSENSSDFEELKNSPLRKEEAKPHLYQKEVVIDDFQQITSSLPKDKIPLMDYIS